MSQATPDRDGQQAAARRLGRGAAVLSLGIAGAGIFTYAFFAVASHTLSRHAYGEITLLWSALFIVVSILYRPVEQLLSRTIAERQALGEIGWGPLRVAVIIQATLAALFVIVALALRGRIEDNLFDGDQTLFWILIVAAVAYAASYFARGFLAGQRRFGLYGGLVTMESLSRFLFALAAAIGLTSGQVAVAAGIAAAPLLSLAVVPWALGRHARGVVEGGGPAPGRPSPRGHAGVRAGEPAPGRPSPRGHAGVRAGDFTLARGTGFAAAVLCIMFSEQTILNAGPLVVNATAGEAAGAALAGYVFNILLIARAPLQLFQAVSTSLLPHLTNLRVTEGDDPFHHSVMITLAAVAAFAAATTLVMAAIGPALMHIFFGNKFDYDRLGLVLVSTGMGFYLAATTVNQAALAQGKARRAAACWLITAAAFVGWLFVPVLEEVRRVEVGFLAGALLLFTLLWIAYRLHAFREEDVVRPGSVEELEARLAAADEGS